MKDKIKTYGGLLLALLGTFVLGLYTAITKHTDQLIEPHQWVLTSMFTIFFLLLFIERVNNKY
jgi:drug/metabolite transporter (DMT)-like permease